MASILFSIINQITLIAVLVFVLIQYSFHGSQYPIQGRPCARLTSNTWVGKCTAQLYLECTLSQGIGKELKKIKLKGFSSASTNHCMLCLSMQVEKKSRSRNQEKMTQSRERKTRATETERKREIYRETDRDRAERTRAGDGQGGSMHFLVNLSPYFIGCYLRTVSLAAVAVQLLPAIN